MAEEPKRRMRIVILCECNMDTVGRRNPYPFQLLRGLEAHPAVEAAQHGSVWLHVPEVSFDVIHVQWPEALYGWEEPTEDKLLHLQKTLQRWGEEAAIVITAHNEIPHYGNTSAYRRLYELVYEHVNGVIHLGEVSRQIMRERYPSVIASKEETVIPHGNYAWFPNEVSPGQARSWLGLETTDQVVLCFGKLRHNEELDLLVEGFRQARLSRGHLLIAGRIPHVERSSLRYFTHHLPLRFSPRVSIHNRFIRPGNVQHYLNAADVVVVSRKHALNSGNVALGFTFGRVVVGPAIGVIGEVLQKTGNPTYDPEQPETLAEAIHKGLELSEKGLGQKNKRYAEEELHWTRLAQQHVDFYRHVHSRSHCSDESRVFVPGQGIDLAQQYGQWQKEQEEEKAD